MMRSDHDIGKHEYFMNIQQNIQRLGNTAQLYLCLYFDFFQVEPTRDIRRAVQSYPIG